MGSAALAAAARFGPFFDGRGPDADEVGVGLAAAVRGRMRFLDTTEFRTGAAGLHLDAASRAWAVIAGVWWVSGDVLTAPGWAWTWLDTGAVRLDATAVGAACHSADPAEAAGLCAAVVGAVAVCSLGADLAEAAGELGSRPLPRGVLVGNAASGGLSTVRLIAASWGTGGGAAPRDHERLLAFWRALCADPSVGGAFTWPDRGPVRRSCCLNYRAHDGRGGVCGDCPLARRAT